jgi:putative tryptophan/tyrosine transport system substrate-binding protein
MLDLRRRQFLTLLGGAAGWPVAAHAPQPAVPIVGFVDGRSAEATVRQTAAFRKFQSTFVTPAKSNAVSRVWLAVR